MIEILEDKLYKLEEAIERMDNGSSYRARDEISYLIKAAESLMAFYQFPAGVVARYNAIKLRFMKRNGEQHIYNTANRSIRINKIRSDAAHIVDLNDLMAEYVGAQQDEIDTLDRTMAGTEEEICRTGTVLEKVRKKKWIKMKRWRYVGGTMIAMLLLYSTRFIKIKIF
ncbi:hypothetical protein ENBRE01_0738 [Enteropsectra breve]|nr:hypothetical protein ENBRE01_0738 [Enteropsectra breve]